MRFIRILAISLAASLSASSALAADCSDWGQITPEEKQVFVSDSATFYIAGGQSCGDADTCTWWVDDDLGTLSATHGSPVDWTAPDALEDCIATTLRIYATCTDGNTTSSANIELRCTDEQYDELRATRGSTISGGGCGSSSAAALLFLLVPGLPRRRRLNNP